MSSEWIGTVLFLVAIGLTGTKIERMIAPWPQWTVVPTLVVFLTLITIYAAAIAAMYGLL